MVASERYTMRLTAKSLRRQLRYAKEVASKIRDPGLRRAYVARAGDLERDIDKWTGTHMRARNYALVVQRRATDVATASAIAQ